MRSAKRCPSSDIKRLLQQERLDGPFVPCQIHMAVGQRLGFTLLELMIVLVILVGVMSIAWPRITGQIQLVAPREAALQVKEDLAEAREQTVITGEPWVLRIERGTGNYEIGPVASFLSRQAPLAASAAFGTDVLTTDSQLSNSEYPSDARGNVEPSSGLAQSIATTNDGNSLSSFGANENAFTRPAIEKLELPTGIIFDDGWAHSTQDVNQFRPDQNTPNVPLAPSLPALTQLNSNLNPVAGIPQQHQWKYVVVFQPDGRATDAEIRLKDQGPLSTIRLRIRGFTGGVSIDGVERHKPVEELHPNGLNEWDPALSGLDALQNQSAAGGGIAPNANPYTTPPSEYVSPALDPTPRSSEPRR